ncbi:MAG: hypothetical protein VKS61_15305 [Candidatus Sericytochromatia bacterium]|nr:hypothetical protein [Candidatus Sericytochromatia bacterium]
MEPGLSLSVLLAPVVIAVMAVALMNVFGRPTDRQGESGAAGEPAGATPVPTRAGPEGRPRLTLTPARYVGGHPARPAPTEAPLVALHDDGLWVASASRREPAFGIPWAAIEQVATLDASQMQFAAGSVRGLAPGALPGDRPEATYVRIRHQDDRGWWQHSVFELDPAHAAAQAESLQGAWEAHRPAPQPPQGSSDGSPEPPSA